MSDPLANSAAHLPPAYVHGDRGERNDVLDIHAAMGEGRPATVAGMEPISLGFMAFLGLMLFLGGGYLMRFSGGFKADHFDERHINDPSELPVQPGAAAADPLAAVKAQGGKVYRDNCAICHNDAGEGKAGIAPPLAGSDWVSTNGIARVARLILDGGSGPITVSGVEFNSASAAMVGFRQTLTDADIAAVLTFLRSSFGNSGDAVKPAQVAAIRKETEEHAGKPWLSTDLLAIPVGGGAAPAPLTLDQLKEKLRALPAADLAKLIEELGKK